jgi:hypothetical protein
VSGGRRAESGERRNVASNTENFPILVYSSKNILNNILFFTIFYLIILIMTIGHKLSFLLDLKPWRCFVPHLIEC